MSEPTTVRRVVKVALSHQSVDMLEELAGIGVLGATAEEVAARFIDEALRRFVEPPKFDLGRK